ncbi:MAG: restriction endonuclease subunit S [Betaproteobacteria bacterium]|nr:restriction endonuclease subunit S [Betaproteobacteria bacterium]
MRESIREGAYGVLPPGDSYNDNLPITFLRATEMKPNLKVDLASCHRVAEEHFNPKARANIGDVLLAVKGATIASDKCVALIEGDPGKAIVNGSIFRMRFKESVNPKFAAVVLDTPLLKRQMRLGLVANNGVDYLDKSMIHSLVFPVPATERQNEIISVYEAAARSHQLGTRKAEEVLAGIDDYLLAELGITLPPEPENALASRIFTVQRRELAGWRFDPYYFGAKFHALEKGLDYGMYPTTSLGQLYLSINNGVDCREFIGGGLPYAKVADVKPFAVDLLHANTVPVDSIPERGFVQKGNLLLTRKGTFGVAALVETDTKFAISSEVFRIELDDSKVLGSYLATVLNSSICQEQFDRQKIGMIMGSLTQASLRRIRLPFPPLEKQREIQTYASRIRQSAAQLTAAAQTELESAKRRIEAMLLGGFA